MPGAPRKSSRTFNWTCGAWQFMCEIVRPTPSVVQTFGSQAQNNIIFIYAQRERERERERENKIREWRWFCVVTFFLSCYQEVSKLILGKYWSLRWVRRNATALFCRSSSFRSWLALVGSELGPADNCCNQISQESRAKVQASIQLLQLSFEDRGLKNSDAVVMSNTAENRCLVDLFQKEAMLG